MEASSETRRVNKHGFCDSKGKFFMEGFSAPFLGSSFFQCAAIFHCGAMCSKNKTDLRSPNRFSPPITGQTDQLKSVSATFTRSLIS
uniref:Uncharacterized protein n=1 Tax=Wuchereria bancrofti TaxID=6293 RepID=A0AAF5PGM7_WUCBA